MIEEEDLMLWDDEFEEWKSRKRQIKTDVLIIVWTLVSMICTGVLMTFLTSTRF